jgi:hypothetical protein
MRVRCMNMIICTMHAYMHAHKMKRKQMERRVGSCCLPNAPVTRKQNPFTSPLKITSYGLCHHSQRRFGLSSTDRTKCSILQPRNSTPSSTCTKMMGCQWWQGPNR